jgi:alkanesulfonate monooxygenase SsuD/methylene tetrahydromethanopterin reductase-like flavin-dependent oxidoreductase (luciferase family)
MTDEVDQLREQYPTWEFGSVWATANSGPDNRRLTARQGTILLTAWDVGELREKLEHEHKTAPPA